MKKLAVILSHPIQYYAPLFRLIHQRERIAIRVYYTWGERALKKYDPGFGKEIAWDIPLLEGYPFVWADNQAKDPGTHHFRGIATQGLTGQVSAWQPDAVLVFGWAYQGHLRTICDLSKTIPVYFRGDSHVLDDRTGIRTMLRRIFLKWVYRHINHAFYTGSNNLEYYLTCGLTHDQLTFAPHAVDNARFAADRSLEANDLRRRLGIGADEILVLFAGKLEKKKSPLELLEAFLSLQKSGVHLLLVGNGELEDSLREKATGSDKVHFMDFQNQTAMPVLYQACDLFCLPSRGPGETWGLAVNEAMACGKAILLSDHVGCAADLVEKKANGRIFHWERREHLAEMLDEMTGSREQLALAGKISLKIISSWTFEAAAKAIENQLMAEINQS